MNNLTAESFPNDSLINITLDASNASQIKSNPITKVPLDLFTRVDTENVQDNEEVNSKLRTKSQSLERINTSTHSQSGSSHSSDKSIPIGSSAEPKINKIRKYNQYNYVQSKVKEMIEKDSQSHRNKFRRHVSMPEIVSTEGRAAAVVPEETDTKAVVTGDLHKLQQQLFEKDRVIAELKDLYDYAEESRTQEMLEKFKLKQRVDEIRIQLYEANEQNRKILEAKSQYLNNYKQYGESAIIVPNSSASYRYSGTSSSSTSSTTLSKPAEQKNEQSFHVRKRNNISTSLLDGVNNIIHEEDLIISDDDMTPMINSRINPNASTRSSKKKRNKVLAILRYCAPCIRKPKKSKRNSKKYSNLSAASFRDNPSNSCNNHNGADNDEFDEVYLKLCVNG